MMFSTSSASGGRAGMLALACALVVVGVAVVKGSTDVGAQDPAASTTNGGPRGLLGLKLLLAAEGQKVHARQRFGDALTPEGASPEPSSLVVLVPPPERTAWTDTEVAELEGLAAAGARIVILCDDEETRNDRSRALLRAFGADCFRADVPIGDDSLTTATSSLVHDAPALFVRGTGRARPRAGAPMFAAWSAGSEPVVVQGVLGAGELVVVGSTTVWANDGLAERGNAALAVQTLARAGGVVVVDERHHGSRAATELIAAAERGYGPWTAVFALSLLVPLSLLGLAPRPGDAPASIVMDGAPAAEAQARALAAWMALVRTPRAVARQGARAERADGTRST